MSFSRFAFLACAIVIPAAAQLPADFSCTASSFQNISRSEGYTEFTGDVMVICKGGTPTATGAFVPQGDVTLNFNVPVTSRILSSTWAEPLLLVNEPGTTIQKACSNGSGGICLVTGTGGKSTYDGSSATAHPNIWQGQVPSNNTILFPAVSIDPPGPNGTLRLRITNIRVNATSLPSDANGQVTATVDISSGGTSVPMTNATVAVSTPLPSFSFEVRDAQNQNVAGTGGNLLSLNSSVSTKRIAVVKFKELLIDSFRTKAANQDSAGNTVPTSAVQNVPGQAYHSESGFYNSALSTPFGVNNAGLASVGSRLRMIFTGIPTGVTLYVSTVNVNFDEHGFPFNEGLDIQARMLLNETGAFTIANATTTIEGIKAAQLPVEGGVVSVAFEITKADYTRLEDVTLLVWASYGSSASSGTATIAYSRAPAPPTIPLSGVGRAQSDDVELRPHPRFKDSAKSVAVFTTASLPTITTTSLGAGMAASSYFATLTVTKGTSPYTWSVATGALPVGLSLNASTGAITGIPAAGTYSIGFKVTDSKGYSDTKTLALQIVTAIGTASALSMASLTPFSGTATSQTFEAVYATPNGYPDITTAYLQLNTTLQGPGGCEVEYDRVTNKMRLLGDDAITWSNAIVVGTANQTLRNSQCILNLATSSFAVAGQQLTVKFALSFTTTFRGRKAIWLSVNDARGGTADWLVYGVWYPGSAAGTTANWYRMYDPTTSTHFYTTDLNEYLTLRAGPFMGEGPSGMLYNAPATASGIAAVPWYRIYIIPARTHFWTTDRNEYLSLIQYRGYYLGEGNDGYILPQQTGTAIPLYRLNFLQASAFPIHHWTTDANEANYLPQVGWGPEGVSGYLYPAAVVALADDPGLIVMSAASRKTGAITPGQLVAIAGVPEGATVRIAGAEAQVVERNAKEIRVLVPEIAAAAKHVNVEAGSLSAQLEVHAARPGIFASDAFGAGQAQAVNADGSENGPNHPASAGEMLTLYITGEGRRALPLKVYIDGHPAEVVSTERAGGRTAVSVVVPWATFEHSTVPVSVRVGEHTAQAGVTLSVR